MKAASLFSGIGGIELGLGQAGWSTELLCEIDPQAQAVLKERFPHTRVASDVRNVEQLPKGVDLLTAGFPCQDLSQAGRTVGIFGKRSGLVDFALRIVARSKPPFVLIENVPFLLRLGRGAGIEHIVNRLEKMGYAWAYRVIDSRAFGLPHRRERVFLLASNVDDPCRYLFTSAKTTSESNLGKVAHGFYWTEGTKGLGWAVDAVPTIKGGSALAIPSPPGIWFPDGMLATPDIRDAERLQGFPANWTRSASEVGKPSFRWTLVGNAVSVPVARWIGERLLRGISIDVRVPAYELGQGDPWPTAAFGERGLGRFGADVDKFPVRRSRPHLHEFLRFDPRPLSKRATGGFLSRLQESSLWRPKAFEKALVRHFNQ